MFPFWDVAIAPVLRAIQARRVVEIGALRGETTIRMIDGLGEGAEVHVIDPVPEFDPSEHERKFPGQYVFHRDLSLNVLPELPPMDAALVDGDHNWYTVYHELKQLAATAREANQPLPVLILHDVCWPYGRRDLYYAPEQIPEEFRQPYEQKGMKKGKKRLLPGGGLNPTMYNAVVEGGARNGVMTGVDDFVAKHDRPLRVVVLPIYFGLAIVAEEERLERQPELGRVLDWLESREGRAELLDLAEDTRLQAMLFQHNVFYHQERLLARAANRYLDLLKGALLNEHYLEHELRIDYLVRCIENGFRPETVNIRDPWRYLKPQLRTLQAARRAGEEFSRPSDEQPASYFPFTTMGRARLDYLQQCLDTLRTEGVRGDFVECGTGRGGGAIFMRGFLEAHEVNDDQVWVVDAFRASAASETGGQPPGRVPGGGRGFPEMQADLNTVRDGFARFDLLDDRVRFLQGSLSETLPDAPIESVALLRVSGEGSEQLGEVLDVLYDRVAVGGYVVVEDLSPENTEALAVYRKRRGIEDPIERIDPAGVCWRKTAVSARAATTETDGVRRLHAPLAPPVPTATRDLSVVVVFYNMRREAPRTLHSLSRAYQRGIEDLDYEVIVVENGSDDSQRLGEEFVRSFGPEFRYIDLGANATPTPVDALNRGMAAASGDALAFMIDGAHVLTPGVLRFGMTGLATYEPSIVATQQWYVGPGQQGDVMMRGYDQAYEDRLFEEIGWPGDGYRLFDIGHFIGDRDWFDGIWESNCLFVKRKLLEQVGAFDENFTMAGGGYANLEFYERLGSSPDVTVTTIIGEGSFHQVHSGTTTNQTDADERRRRIASYAQHFAELRGRNFRGPGKPMHYVGSMPPSAIRSKARRRYAPNLFKVGRDDPEGIPKDPLPIPEELRNEFIDAFWRSLAWQDTTWLGERVEKAPTDLLVYQELVTRLRPDWIVETRSGSGGRALFFASICELLGHGRVLSIAPAAAGELLQHPRITYLTGNTIADETISRVRETVGTDPNALVVLGARDKRQRIVKEFNAYAPLVPLGSYVIIEDTVVNGHPVWPSFGPGPAEAVKNVINTRGDFAPDPDMERFGLTMNPSGFMKRVL